MTLTPTLIISLLVSSYFSFNRYHELEQQLSDAGQALIEPLALASEIGLINESRESVRRLIGHSHRQHSEFVRSISVFNSNNKLFVTSNYHRNPAKLALPKGAVLLERLEISRFNDSLLLRTPIRAIADFSSGFAVEQPIGYIAMEIDLASVKLKQYQEIISTAVILVLGLILASLFSYRLLTHVEIPIQQMISMIDRIRRGHLDVRVEGDFFGELGALKNGINAMAISLSEYHLEMQQNIDQATSDLRETAEQLEVQNVELAIAKKDAQEAARVKSEFLANMSHELRTPLNSVLGFTRQMLKTQLSDNQREQLQTIEKSAKNLLSIINDILDFSKLEANKLQLETISFNLEDNLDDVMSLLAPMAHERGLELNLRIDPKIPINVIGDPLRIQQVLINIIANATKFTERGYININVELKQHINHKLFLQLSVMDTGIGISEKQQDQLFKAFQQADASINRRYGGTGLGLVITQKLVHQMGGEIGFSSRLHHGSTFWFTIQLEQDITQPPEKISIEWESDNMLLFIDPDNTSRQYIFERLKALNMDVRAFASFPKNYPKVHTLLYCHPANEKVEESAMILYASKANNLAENIIFSLPATILSFSESLTKYGVKACLSKPIALKKLFNAIQPNKHLTTEPTKIGSVAIEKLPVKVMAVDDNDANLKLISALLSELVEDVVLVPSGLKAIEQANLFPFDLILMDIQMPEMDGVCASKKVRQTALNKKTPIIAVTAHALETERKRLLSEGMDGYLTKPIDENALIKLIKQWTLSKPAQTPTQSQVKIQIPTQIQTKHKPKTSIDWEEAVTQSAGKLSLAQELLAMLINSFDDVEAMIELAINGGQVDLKAIIHKLHGSCAYSGVPQLKALCFEIESQLKRGETIDAIEPELFELIDEMNKVKKQAQEFLTLDVNA